MNDTSEALIKYRLDRAYEVLDEAKFLSANAYWNLATNRLYYACFYALLALMAKHQIKAYSHKGIKVEFGRQFIKTGLFSRADGKLFSDLFNKRHESDYEDFVNFDESTVKPLIPEVETFIKKVADALK